MKIAVIGSRDFADYQMLCDVMKNYQHATHIISGGARGADSLAAKYAKSHDVELIEFIPDWEIGKHAGHIRNQDIIDAADQVIAFWDMHSPGTKDSIRRAKRAGKPVMIVNINQVQNPLPFE